jgi:hypothetical protein
MANQQPEKLSKNHLPLMPLSEIREAEKRFERAFGWRLLLILMLFIVVVLGLAAVTHEHLWMGFAYIPVFVLMGWVIIMIVNSLSRRFALICQYCGSSIAQVNIGNKEIPAENYQYCARCKREIVNLGA